MSFLTISNPNGDKTSFELGNIVGFKFDEIEVGVTPIFLYNLLVKKNQEALESITRTSTADLMSEGR